LASFSSPGSYRHSLSDLSRWEHASKDRAAAVALLAGALAAAVAAAFVAQGFLPKRYVVGRVGLLALSMYLVALGVAWLALTIGH
jgi:hypothetical protein